MADFAQLDEDNKVVNIIVIHDDDLIDKSAWWDPLRIFTGKREPEAVGISVCQKLVGPDTLWKLTYIHREQECHNHGRMMRGNAACIGMVYMEDVKTLGVASTDVFIWPQPFPSWTIGIHTAFWYPPVETPILTAEEKSFGQYYEWSEDKLEWVRMDWDGYPSIINC